MIEEKEELMVPPSSGVHPTLRKAHFLKPILNPEDQQFPKPHSDLPLCSDPTMNMHELIRKRVFFRGRIKQQKGWKKWVEDLQQTHQEIWKKAGIFDAIIASTYNIRRHNELIFWLAQNWCPNTNTFIFPWGETTITLEDVLILGGFSVLGLSVLSPVRNPESKELEKKLIDGYAEIKKNSIAYFVTHNQWMKYFNGCGRELENVAFIVLWLSRYVFSTNHYTFISPLVFQISIALAKATRIALAPAVLASIYRDLSLLRQKIVSLRTSDCVDDLGLNLWSPLQLLQLWAWERFPTLSPKPTSLNPGEPRLARWHNMKKPKLRCFGEEFLGDEFVWRPYTLSLINLLLPKYYPDQETWVLMNSDVDEELVSWVRFLRASQLVGMDCLEPYMPYRVGMQFGMDQDIPGFFPRSTDDDVELAWRSYDEPLDGCLKLYLPPRLFEGDVTTRYSSWWRDTISVSKKSWLIYERQRRSHRKLKRMPIKDLIENLPSLETTPNQFSEDLVNNDAKQCHQIGKNKGKNGKNSSSLETIPNQCSQNLVNNVSKQCEQIGIEEEKGKELKKGGYMTINIADCSNHSVENWPRNVTTESQGTTESKKEPLRGSHDLKNLKKEVKKEADNIVMIIDEVEEESRSDCEPFQVLGGCELEARILKLERQISHLKATRQGYTNSK